MPKHHRVLSSETYLGGPRVETKINNETHLGLINMPCCGLGTKSIQTEKGYQWYQIDQYYPCGWRRIQKATICWSWMKTRGWEIWETPLLVFKNLDRSTVQLKFDQRDSRGLPCPFFSARSGCSDLGSHGPEQSKGHWTPKNNQRRFP
jgi:hypothetical protein